MENVRNPEDNSVQIVYAINKLDYYLFILIPEPNLSAVQAAHVCATNGTGPCGGCLLVSAMHVAQDTTPPVPNYKSFQEFWRVKPSQSLTKIIERNTKIYDIKYVYYENITNKESNDT